VPYSTWGRNASVLAAAGFRVLRYEHYGRGYSDRPRCAYDLGIFVEQLDELVRALGLGRPLVLIGLSMGGPVAVAAAARLPGLAAALVLVDPLYSWPLPRGASRLLMFPPLGEAIMALAGPQTLVGGQRGDFYSEASYEEFRPFYLPHLAYRGMGRAVLATIRSIPSWPLAETYDSYGRLGIPTLVFWGRMDATLPIVQSEALLAAVPSARLHVVEGAGHVPHWEKADEVNAETIAFLRTLGEARDEGYRPS
jgi:pimeloyl-ACP methyl ester carboxylesterase